METITYEKLEKAGTLAVGECIRHEGDVFEVCEITALAKGLEFRLAPWHGEEITIELDRQDLVTVLGW